MKQRIIPLMLALIAFFAVSASMTYVVTSAVNPVAETTTASKTINFKGSSGSTATGTLGDQVKTGTDPWKGIWTSTQTGTAPSDLQLKITAEGAYFYLSTNTSATIYLNLNQPNVIIDFTPTDSEWYVSSIKYTFYARNTTTVLETKGESRSMIKGTNPAVTVEYSETDKPRFTITGVDAAATTYPYLSNVIVTLSKKSEGGSVTPDPDPDPEPTPPILTDGQILVSSDTGAYSGLSWSSTQTEPTGATMTGEGLTNSSLSGMKYTFNVSSTIGKVTFAPTVEGYYVSGYTFKATTNGDGGIDANGTMNKMSSGAENIITVTGIREGTPAVATFYGSNTNMSWTLSSIVLTLEKGTATVDPDPGPGDDPNPEGTEVTFRVNKSFGTFSGNNSWASTQTSPTGLVLLSQGSATRASSLSYDVEIQGNSTTTFTLAANAPGWYVSGYSFDAISYASTARSITANGTVTNVPGNKRASVKVDNLQQGTAAVIIFDSNNGTLDYDLDNFTVTLKKGKVEEPVPDLEVPEGAYGLYVNSTTGGGTSSKWQSTDRSPGVDLICCGATMQYFPAYVYADFQNSSSTGTLTLTPTPGYYVSDYSFTAVGTLVKLWGNEAGPVTANINGEKMIAKDIPVGTFAVINYEFTGSQSTQKNFQLRDLRVILKPLPKETLQAVTLTNASTGQVLRLDSSNGELTTEAKDGSDLDQLWVIKLKDDHSGEYVRHYTTGRYLRVPVSAGGRFSTIKATVPADERMLYRIDYKNTDKTQASFPLKYNAAGRLLGISGGDVAGVTESDATAVWNLTVSPSVTEEMILARKSDWDTNVLTTAFDVDKASGTLSRTDGNTSSAWSNVWTSDRTTPAQLTISCPVANIQWNGDNLDMRTGTSQSAEYTLSLSNDDWYITGYSFVAKNLTSGQNVTIVTPIGTITSSNNGTYVEVTGLMQDRSIKLVLSGPNSGTEFVDFKVNVARKTEYNTYRLASRNSGMVLKSDAETGALSLVEATDDDWSQMWIREVSTNGDGVYLRNLATGRYLVSPLELDAKWLSRKTTTIDGPSMLMTMDLPMLSNEVTIYPRANAATGALAAGSDNVPVSKASTDTSAVWIWSGVEGVSRSKVDDLKSGWKVYPIDLKAGRIYRITNTLYSDRSMSGKAGGTIYSQPTDNSDYSQLWLLEEKSGADGYYMRNLKTGFVVRASRARSAVWKTQYAQTLDDTNMLLNFLPSGSGWYINTLLDEGSTDDGYLYGFAHDPSGHDIKGWSSTGVPASKWDITEITDLPQETIDYLKSRWCVTEVKPGKAYRFRNTLYGDLMAASGSSVVGVDTDPGETAIWICEETASGTGFLLRNFSDGSVVESPRTQNGAWTLNPEYMPPKEIGTALCFPAQLTGLNITTCSTADQSGSYTFAHENNQKTVLGWVASSTASIWNVEEVSELTPEMIEAKRRTWNNYVTSNYEMVLREFFTDDLCMELRPEYASMPLEELEMDPRLMNLPEELRAMVSKIRTGDWSEYENSEGGFEDRVREWDSEHAKKMRAQIYEPYSNSNDVAGLFSVQAFNNFCNATGLLAEKGKKLYVMVDRAPRDDQYLTIHFSRLRGVGDLQGVPGTKLRKGLNVIEVPADAVGESMGELQHVCIYNIAKTCSGKTRLAPLSEFPDIKIHIEGGVLNGYMNTQGDEWYPADTNDDWLYYRERARSPRFPVIAKWVTYTLDMVGGEVRSEKDGVVTVSTYDGIRDYFTPERVANGSVDLVKSFDMYDETVEIEYMMMGLMGPEVIDKYRVQGKDFFDYAGVDGTCPDDYWKYNNSKVLFISDPGSKTMNATWYRVAYPSGYVNGTLAGLKNGADWGCAHELGHINQPLVKLAGTTEISVNFFSTVVAHYYSESYSRHPYPSEVQKCFREKKNIYEYGLYGLVRSWFQMWAYYHKLGHDRNFTPRLFELLRRSPLRTTRQPDAPSHQVNPVNIKTDLLHYVKKCCEAAGEDLTDFFESSGYFVALPDTGMFVGDYNNYQLYLSQKDIDDVKAEIAAMATANGWKKNKALKFLDNRVGYNPAAGTIGGFDDFRTGKVTGDYKYYVSGTTVHMVDGAGGVGYQIEDLDGNLIGYGNTPEFVVTMDVARMLDAGTAKLSVITKDNEQIEIYALSEHPDPTQRRRSIEELLKYPLLKYLDPEERTLGAIRRDVLPELTQVYDEVRTAYREGLIHEYNVKDYYDRLNYYLCRDCDIELREEITNYMIDNAVYVFESNIRHTGIGLKANDDGTKLTHVPVGEVDCNDLSQQWRFEANGDGSYSLRNMKTGTYLVTPGTALGMDIAMDIADRKGNFNVYFRDMLSMAVCGNGRDVSGIVYDGSKVVNGRSQSATIGTDTDDHKDGRWLIRLYPDWKKSNLASDILIYIEKSEQLLSECGNSDPELAELCKELREAVTDGNTAVDNMQVLTYSQLMEAYDALDAAYEILLEAFKGYVGKLTNLVNRTRALTETVGTVKVPVNTPTPNSYISPSFFFSNAPHTSGADAFNITVVANTHWKRLFDNNLTTYFQSNYAGGNSTDGLDHYIRMKAPRQEGLGIILRYTTRAEEATVWAPTKFSIQTSADGTNWTDIYTIDEGLPTGPGETYQCPYFVFPSGHQYFRFMVHESLKNADATGTELKGGHAPFAVSEWQPTFYRFECSPDTEKYPAVTDEIMHEAWMLALEGERILNVPTATDDQVREAYEELKPVYDYLLELVGRQPVDISSMHLRCVDDCENSKQKYDDIAYAPEGQKVEIYLEGLPEGYPDKEIKVTFTGIDTQKVYEPKGYAKRTDDGYISVNYPKDMPTGRYIVKVTLPTTDEFYGYEGDMTSKELHVYMKREIREALVAVEGDLTLRYEHSDYLETNPKHFIFRLAQAPVAGVRLYYKVIPEGQDEQSLRIRRRTTVPDDHEEYNHETGVKIPRDVPNGTISFVAHENGVAAPAVHLAYVNMPAFDLQSGYYLVGSFSDFEVNEDAILLTETTDAGIYAGYYNPGEIPSESVVLMFAKYDVNNNSTTFYGPREKDVPNYGPGTDMTMETLPPIPNYWEGLCGTNSARWTIEPAVFIPEIIDGPGLKVAINTLDDIVGFGGDFMTITEAMQADSDEVFYFTVDGLRVIKPSKGIYIRVQKGKAQEVMIK